MDRAELRRVMTNLRFSRKWEPKLVLQVLDASPETSIRMWAFFWLAKLGYHDARAAFLDLFRTCSREWFAELEGLEAADRLITTLTTMEIVGAPPLSGAERKALLSVMAQCESLLDRRLDGLVAEEERQGWEFSTDQILRRLDGKPLQQVLNLWEGTQ